MSPVILITTTTTTILLFHGVDEIEKCALVLDVVTHRRFCNQQVVTRIINDVRRTINSKTQMNLETAVHYVSNARSVYADERVVEK